MSILGNSWEEEGKGRGYGDHTTEILSRALTPTTSRMGGANLPGKTVKFTRENSRTISVMEKVVTDTPTAS